MGNPGQADSPRRLVLTWTTTLRTSNPTTNRHGTSWNHPSRWKTGAGSGLSGKDHGLASTFQALGVLLLAFLPGALYVWAFEREAGGWGLGVADRFLRFVGFSAVFHALAAPLTYIAYRDFVLTGRLAHGKALPLWLWIVPVLYVVVPALAGSLIGNKTSAGKRWTRYVAGRSAAPRAWDHLFASHDLSGWIRLRLKNDDWIVGAYAPSDNRRLRSYAAGYPDAQDLYLVETADCEPGTGRFLLNPDGTPRLRGVGVLVR